MTISIATTMTFWIVTLMMIIIPAMIMIIVVLSDHITMVVLIMLINKLYINRGAYLPTWSISFADVRSVSMTWLKDWALRSDITLKLLSKCRKIPWFPQGFTQLSSFDFFRAAGCRIPTNPLSSHSPWTGAAPINSHRLEISKPLSKLASPQLAILSLQEWPLHAARWHFGDDNTEEMQAPNSAPSPGRSSEGYDYREEYSSVRSSAELPKIISKYFNWLRMRIPMDSTKHGEHSTLEVVFNTSWCIANN